MSSHLVLDPGLVGFAFSLGVLTFFSPCSVALVPAYVAFFTGLGPAGATSVGEGTARWTTLRAAITFATAASMGILAVFAVFGAAIFAARTLFDLPSLFLGRGLAVVAVMIGGLVIFLGILMFVGIAPSFTPRLRAPTTRSPLAMAGFGALYSFASLGCTLPLFFSVLSTAILAGAIGGSVLIGAFASGFAGLMFVVTLAMTLATEPARKVLVRIMPYVKKVSATVMVAAGVYIVWYYLVIAPPA